MLALLIERARTVDSPAAVPSDTAACPNCSIPVASTRSPYCGEQCREVAGFVRHVRSGLVEGSILVPDRQVALGQVLWHILGGGRPLRREIAPKRSLETAFKREGGKCQGCGAPATTVDHIGSGCNRPINLRAVCGDCCLDRAFGDPLVTGRPGYAELFDELAARIASPHPVRCCDDAATWDWRAHVRSRT
jgi:hypothetical protein